MNRIGMASTLRSVFNKKRRRKAGFARRRQSSADYKIEPLEQRRVLAVDFVSAAVVDGEPFFTVQADQGLVVDAGALTESPQQVILRFTPGTEIDPASLSGISIVRSGGRGDGFEADGEGSLSDIAVSPGVLVVDDSPASNQIVIRFQETLPDDSYRFTISSSVDALGEITGIRTTDGQAFRGGGSFSFDVQISLPPQVVAVVPQPISRDATDLTAPLSQARDVIDVYFNDAEAIDQVAAETVSFYKLIKVNADTGEDEPGSTKYPLQVTYDSSTNKATLKFFSDSTTNEISDGTLYRLEIGGNGILFDPQVVPPSIGDAGSSFTTALSAGSLDESGVTVSASIDAEGAIAMPGSLPDLAYPNQPGTIDEPGHRDIPIDYSNHGLEELGLTAIAPPGTEIFAVPFNFQTHYGDNTQGNPLSNLITAEQKIRVREVFDLFSRYAGVRFVETAAEGITVALGDTRVISDNSPVASLEGLWRGSVVAGVPTDDALAIVNANRDWGESEYGGAFFRAAMRQIGKVLGMWHSYDVPSVLGESLPGEGVFPSDYDLIHLQQLFPRGGTDIDLYRFSLTEPGTLSAETVAGRLPDGASTLDTVLSVFSETYEATAQVTGGIATVVGKTAELDLSSTTIEGVATIVSKVGATVEGFPSTVQGVELTVAGAESEVVGFVDTVAGVAARVTGLEATVQAVAAQAVGTRATLSAIAAQVVVAADATTTVVLDDVSAVAVDAPVIGLSGVPADTTVLAIDTLANSVVLSNAVTLEVDSFLGFGFSGNAAVAARRFLVSDASAAAVGVSVNQVEFEDTTETFFNDPEGIPAGTRVTAVNVASGMVLFSSSITVADGDELGFGSNTAQIALDDVVAIPVGATLGLPTGNPAIDSQRPRVVAVNQSLGVVTLSAAHDVVAGATLAFDHNPVPELSSPTTARRFFFDSIPEEIVEGLLVSAPQGVAAGTIVETIERIDRDADGTADEFLVTFSQPVTLGVGANVGFGFSGNTVKVDDASAVRSGATVEGIGVPLNTTVTGVNVSTGEILLSTAVNVPDGVDLGFSLPTTGTVSTDRLVMVSGGRGITVGSQVTRGDGTALGISVTRVDGRVVTFSGMLPAAAADELSFGVTGNTVHVADTTGIVVGSLVTAASGVGPDVAVTAVDHATGRLILSKAVTLPHKADVQFGFFGNQVTVEDGSGVEKGAIVTAAAGVGPGITVRDFDEDTNILTLSGHVSVTDGSLLAVGTIGDVVKLADLTGLSSVADGVQVTGPGVPAGTRVAAGGVDLVNGTVTLTESVTVAAGSTLGFGSNSDTIQLNTSSYHGKLEGASISLNGIVVPGVTVLNAPLAVNGSTAKLTGSVDVADGDRLAFSFSGSLTTSQIIVADASIVTVGAKLATGEEVIGVDQQSKLVTLSGDLTVSSNDPIVFGYGGTEIVVSDASGIVEGAPLAGPGIPDGTFVTKIDGTRLTLSQSVETAPGDDVDIGFYGDEIRLVDATAAVVGAPVSGLDGIRPATTVTAITPTDPTDLTQGGLIELSQPVRIAAEQSQQVSFGVRSTSTFGPTKVYLDDTSNIIAEDLSDPNNPVVGTEVRGLPGVPASETFTVVGKGSHADGDWVEIEGSHVIEAGLQLQYSQTVSSLQVPQVDVSGDIAENATVTLNGAATGVTVDSYDPATGQLVLSGGTITVTDGDLLGFGVPSRELIARNDNAFGRDSFLKIDLDAGNYFVAVTSVGNTDFNPAIEQSGGGGRTEGEYDLNLKFKPAADSTTTLSDTSGTPLDGDRDGRAGGAFNFWFRTADEADTVYVDKLKFDASAVVTNAVEDLATISVDSIAGLALEVGMEVVGPGVPIGAKIEAIIDPTTIKLSEAVTIDSGKVIYFALTMETSSGDRDGTLALPYRTIEEAIAEATDDPDKTIIRILGNTGDELSGLTIAGTSRSLRPNALAAEIDPHHYYVGLDESGNPLTDGASLTVPAGVTLMVDAGAVLRMRQANIDVGSSTELVSRAGASLQVLGVPDNPVRITSAVQGATVGEQISGPIPEGGDWGGIVLRADSDWQLAPDKTLALDTLRPFLNTINHAVIEYAGGEVIVDSELKTFSAVQLEDARPALGYNQILRSSSSAIAATPNSFLEAGGRAGPQLAGNTLLLNSTNGLFIAIRTEYGVPLDTLDVAARLTSTEVTYVLQENLVLTGGQGSYYKDSSEDIRARESGRLTVDPGVVVKLQNARIELERGSAQLIAEGHQSKRIIFTNLGDNRFGAGGTFDTNGNLPEGHEPGRWGGIILNAGSQASIDNAFILGGGGEVPIEGTLDFFNVIEVHQGDLRLANSRLQNNGDGLGITDRTARGENIGATIFVRGAQPVVVNNDFRDNAGALISINANSMTDRTVSDPGRQSGLIARVEAYDSNQGPLFAGNTISYSSIEVVDDTLVGPLPAQSIDLAGVLIRGEEIVVDSVWDDTDIVHVLQDEIVVNNLHTATSLKLLSQINASLVVKLAGPDAGFTASGEPLDIDDRVGGTVQVIGQPGFPVVLTSIHDDSVGASLDAQGFPVTDTNVNGSNTAPTAGDWRSLQFLPLSNDRNVGAALELEPPYTNPYIEVNNTINSAEFLGTLAPNYATDGDTWESAQEKSGDENRRLGFDVSGTIAFNDSSDVDIYSFDGYAGSEVWVDIDQTSGSLDSMVEVLDASGRVLARSANSQTDTGSVTGAVIAADPGGTAVVTGAEAAVVGAAAAVTGVGAQVDGIDVTVTGVAARATGYQAQVIGIGAQALLAASAGDTSLTLDDATGVRIGATPTLAGVIPVGAQVTAVIGNTITLDQPLDAELNAGDWIAFNISGIDAFSTSRIIFDVPPEAGVWVGDEFSGNTVQSVEGIDNNIVVLGQAIGVVPDVQTVTRSQNFSGYGWPYSENGVPTDAAHGVQNGADPFYRLLKSSGDDGPRNISFSNIVPQGWEELTIQAEWRIGAPATADGPGFRLQDSSAPVDNGNPEGGSNPAVNMFSVHFDVFDNGDAIEGTAVGIPHMSVSWGGATEAVPFTNLSGEWRDVQITLRPHVSGAALSVSLDQQVLVEDYVLAGYTIGRSTAFIAGARSGSAGAGDHDVDDVRAVSLLPQFSSATEVELGLAGSITNAKKLSLDNASPIQIGSTVDGTATAVTSVSLLTATEPNDVLATATPLAIASAFGGASQFQTTGTVGDGTYGDRDVDFYRLDVPTSAIGSTFTIEGSTQGVDPTTAIGDIYLRLFDAGGNVVAFDNNSGPGLDSRLTFTVPQSYDGSGYFVGVSGFANNAYDPAVAGSGISGSTGDYILRGSFTATFTVAPVGGGAAEGVVTFDNPVSVTDNELLTFSLAPAQPVSTIYVTVDDASQVAVGAQITGTTGIPDGTTVIDRDLVTNVLELSQPISVSLDDLASIGFVESTIIVEDASALADGMSVTGAGVPSGTFIAVGGIAGNTVSFDDGSGTPVEVDLAAGQFLQFGFVGGSITTDTLYLDDTAITIGASVEAASAPGAALATVLAIDTDTNAVTLSQTVTVTDGELLIFSFNGQPITARRVVVDDASGVSLTVLVNEVGVSALDQDVPDGTTVVDVEPISGSGILELSGPVTVRTGDSLGFGFNGTDVELDDVTGIELGELVGGDGVPPNATVTNVDGNTNIVTLSVGVNVEDGTLFTFGKQEFSLLPAVDAPGAVSVLPGSLTGVIYDGDTAVQTFAAQRDGTLVFMPVGSPPVKATGGTVDYVTGEVSLIFNTPPRQAIRLEADFDYSPLSLPTLGFEPVTGKYGAYPLTKDAWRGEDYYTTNPRDAGMRLTLPGTVGTKQKYFIRVRSQPGIGGDPAAYEASLAQASPLAPGQTSGNYDLSVRLRQRDETPGSTVRFADIRYPVTGIDVVGLPNNSPLVGTAGEQPDGNNNTFATAQPLGNLLTSDRNTISVAGSILNEDDVDWYSFTLSYEEIQSLFGHNDGAKTWSTVFDIDYADGFRGDLTLSVFDANGALIYIGRDSNVADDQPGPGQEGGDVDDLSRGSVGTLDPFIGPAFLPAGSDGTAGPRTYYVAVSSNERLPAILDQTFTATATNSNVRLEPVTSIARVVEDHIWGDGHLTYDPIAGSTVPQVRIESQSIFADAFDEVGLSVNIRPYTLSDVVLYVSTNGSIEAVNPFTGQDLRELGRYNGGTVGDIDMRTDGSLFQYFGANNDNANNGLLREVSWVDGSVLSSAGDGISDDPDTPTYWQITGQSVDALAIRRTGTSPQFTPQYGTNNADSGIYYSVRDGGQSVLYWARPNGDAATVQNEPNGRRGVITGTGVSGITTGLQFQNDSGSTLYGVSSGGQFFQVNRGTGAATAVVDFANLPDPVTGLTIAQQGGFQGLANAPVNLEGGRYQGWFFALTGSGRLVVINPNAAGGPKIVENIFDTNADGVADSYMSLPTAGSTGLAFSPLDVNPWHATRRRRLDDGHGVNTVPDESRYDANFETYDGYASFYFGIEEYRGQLADDDFIYNNGGQYGVEYATWQTDLTSRSDIGDNYNLPGGAQGSLVSSSFSLDGYSAADKPTLYFNYFLETEDASADDFADYMLDSARVFASRDGGATWELLATNNSERSGSEEYNYQSELPHVASASSGISSAGYNFDGVGAGRDGTYVPNQRVQELFDVAQWRQARVDLADFAGEAEIYLRFDFSTAGEMAAGDNSTATPVATKTVDGVVVASRTVGLDSTVGVSVGMVVNLAGDQFLVSGDDMQSATVVGVDADAGLIELDSVVSLSDGALLQFFNPNQLKNVAEGFAGTIGLGNFTNPNDDSTRFTANDFEGFYIDDIIIGFAERGEIVSGASGNATDFFDLGTPVDSEYPIQNLAGEYQLEIRRGTEYGTEPYQTTTGDAVRRFNGAVAIHTQFDTNARFVSGEGSGVLQLAASSLSLVDGVTITHAGDGRFDASGNGVLLTAGGAGGSNQNLLGWNVDLEGVPGAVLNFTSAADEVELHQVIPETFRVGPGVRLAPVDSLATGSFSAMSVELGATDDYAFVGVLGELQIYDIASDPSSPALVGSVAIGKSWEVSISPNGDYAYVADDSGPGVGGLVIVDISDKQSPQVVSRVAALGRNSWGVTVSPDGNTVYLGDADAGVQIIDVSDPANPVRKAVFKDAENFTWSENVVLSADGTKLFVTNGYNGLQIVDVSSPQNPVLIGSVSNGSDVWHRRVTLLPDKQTAFIAQDGDGIAAVDISDLSNPVTIWQRSTADQAKDVALSPNGDELYVTTQSGGLEVYDVSVIQTPLLISGGATNGSSASVTTTSNGANVYVTTISGFLETFERSVGGSTDLPSGDGVAVSLDGGVNWRRVAMIEGQGQQSVDLMKAVGPLTADTVIGFFQGGTSTSAGIRISDLSVTTDFPQEITGTIGDSNNVHEFEQGQFVIQSNFISNAAVYGVSIDAGRNDQVDPYGNYLGITNEPDLGVARNLPVLNNSRLVPGAVVSNNVISGAGVAGVLFSGTTNTDVQPQSVVPYGRIVNNTIYGGANSGAVGIDVNENAGPTILNNVFAELAMGVQVDSSSRFDAGGSQRTVIGTSAFHAVGVEVSGADQNLGVTLNQSPFINGAGGNFYPATGTAIVDSSLSSLQDRNEYRVVTEPLGIAPSPIVAPIRDIYGQLRVDDPQQANEPGLGGTVFQDRGAVERVDQTRPYGRIVVPLDQGASPLDTDDNLDSVVIEGPDARGVRTIVIQLLDVGVGIDKSTVSSDAFVVTRDGVRLLDTIDYHWVYNENTDQVLFRAISVFPLGEYLIEVNSAAADSVAGVAGKVTDRANNPLRVNADGGRTTYFVALADVPGQVNGLQGVAGDEEIAIEWIPPRASLATPVLDYTVQWIQQPSGEPDWTTAASATVTETSFTATGLSNNTPYLFRVTARNAVGSGAPRQAATAIVPRAPATAPQNLNGTADFDDTTKLSQIDLNWVASGDLGDNTLKNYRLEYRLASDTAWTEQIDGVSAALTAVVDANGAGLTVGEAYVFRVAAITEVAESGERVVGAYSAEVTVTAEGVPAAPTGLVAAPNGKNLEVSWTAPDDGGQPIDDYIVEINLSNPSSNPNSWLTYNDGVSFNISATLADGGTLVGPDLSQPAELPPGKDVWVRVKAVNSHGSGDFSASSARFTMPDVPSGNLAVTELTPADRAVTIKWSYVEPSSSSEAPVTNFLVSKRVVGEPDFDVPPVEIDALAPLGNLDTRIVNGTKYEFKIVAENAVELDVSQLDNGTLANGTAYEFKIVAKNAVEQGASIITAAVTPRTTPDAPANLAGTRGDRRLTLNWDAPANDGGTPVIDYEVQYRLSGDVDWTPFSDGTGTQTEATVTGLVNGQEYEVQVRARTAEEGAWAQAGPFMPQGLSTPPTAVVATVPAGVSGTVNLSWNVPADTGGASLTGYEVEGSTDGGISWDAVPASVDLNNATAVVDGLIGGVGYNFRVAAETSAGTGVFSVRSNLVVPNQAAPAPLFIDGAAEGGPGTSIQTYNTPSQELVYAFTYNSLAIPDSYQIRVTAGGQVLLDLSGVSEGNAVEILKPSGVQQLTVEVTGGGEGTAWSYELAPKPSGNSVAVAWKNPSQGYGSAVADYQVEWTELEWNELDQKYEPLAETTQRSFTANRLGFVASELKAETKYQFRVRAKLVTGMYGDWSEVSVRETNAS